MKGEGGERDRKSVERKYREGGREDQKTIRTNPDFSSPVCTGEANVSIQDEGNAKFRKGDMQGALMEYTQGINTNPDEELVSQLLSNRSACLVELEVMARCEDISMMPDVVYGQRLEEALEDAKACVKIKPKFAKGHFRISQAMLSLARSRLKKNDGKDGDVSAAYDHFLSSWKSIAHALELEEESVLYRDFLLALQEEIARLPDETERDRILAEMRKHSSHGHSVVMRVSYSCLRLMGMFEGFSRPEQTANKAKT
eukprot:759276-Hanusia_phi.AAC.4